MLLSLRRAVGKLIRKDPRGQQPARLITALRRVVVRLGETGSVSGGGRAKGAADSHRRSQREPNEPLRPAAHIMQTRGPPRELPVLAVRRPLFPSQIASIAVVRRLRCFGG